MTNVGQAVTRSHSTQRARVQLRVSAVGGDQFLKSVEQTKKVAFKFQVRLNIAFRIAISNVTNDKLLKLYA